MTELAITPKWKDKEAKFRGVVAAGEHVAVTIQNDDGSGNAFISDTETLRLNVIDPTSGRLLATFPTPVEDGETPETWSESGTQLSCELNLNTVQMLKAVLPASVASLLFVLDDYENKTLYFKAQHEVAHWPRRRGEEEPLNLDGYKDIIRVFGLRLTAVEETAKSAAASAASAATSSATSAQAAKAAAAAATGSQGSAANSATVAETAKTGAETARDEAKEYAESAESVLANAATKGALQAEINRASQAELGLFTRIDAVDVNVTNLLGGKGAPDMNKSVRQIAGEEVAKVVANAPADLDTLKEIAAYIESDKTGAAQMVTQIDANAKAISAEVTRAKGAEAALDGRVKELEENGGGVAELMIKTTHAELKTLRDTGKLIPGMQYRITDYVATTVQMHTQSANHPFDIIVTADSPNKLNEVARAIRHDGDAYFPETTKFGAWQIWYSLDNDTNRFEWADPTNGKGVIYRMIDEFNNDIPYDFKGVKMRAFLGFDDEFNELLSDDYRYTFGVDKDDTLRGAAYSNMMKPVIVFVYDENFENVLGIKSNINNNTFGSGCYNNTLGSGCSYNTFGSDCYANTFDSDCYSNTLGEYCYNNTFGSGCYNNTFGSGCYNNTLGSGCYDNTFGSDCFNNIFGVGCTYNMLGTECYANIFTLYCDSNLFPDYFAAVTVQSSVSGNIINGTEDRGEYEYCKNIEIKSGVFGKEINIDGVEQSYHTEIRPEGSITITV